jgi:glycosyltransferase involved in cell wall biosynthesis
LKNDLLTLTTSEADRVVTISKYNKRAILEKNQSITSDHIEVIRCGIDLETFSLESQQSSTNRVEIISVGGLVEKKGHQILIPACAELASRGIDFRCTIVGEGRLRKTLEALIAQYGLENKVELAGARSQSWVRERLSHSDIFVLASVIVDEGERDGIPVAIMEALATGIPAVSTNVSGIPELVKDGVSGLLVPQKNIKALTNALAMLAENEALRRDFAQNGRLLIEEEYDIEKNAAKLLDLFTKVIREQ